MIELLKWAFSDNLVDDHRPVAATFQLPGLEGVYAIFPPHPGLWVQLIAVSQE